MSTMGFFWGGGGGYKLLLSLNGSDNSNYKRHTHTSDPLLSLVCKKVVYLLKIARDSFFFFFLNIDL